MDKYIKKYNMLFPKITYNNISSQKGKVCTKIIVSYVLPDQCDFYDIQNCIF